MLGKSAVAKAKTLLTDTECNTQIGCGGRTQHGRARRIDKDDGAVPVDQHLQIMGMFQDHGLHDQGILELSIIVDGQDFTTHGSFASLRYWKNNESPPRREIDFRAKP